MVTRNLRRLLYRTDVGGSDASRHAQALAEAKALAGRLIPELAALDCPPAVMGTALAIIVGVVASKVRVASREDFYDKFLCAARACEQVTAECVQLRREH